MKSILNLLLNKGIKSPKPRPMIVPAPYSNKFNYSNKEVIRTATLLILILISGAFLIENTLLKEHSGSAVSESADNESGLRLLEQRNYSEAEKFYREKVAKNPDLMSAQINLAHSLKNLKMIKEAEAIYLSLLKRHPNEAVVWNNLGVLYSQTGRLNEAEESFLKAIKNDVSYSDAALNLGFNYEKQSNFNEAILQYQRTLENPNLKPQQVKFLVDRMRQLHAVANSQINSGEKL